MTAPTAVRTGGREYLALLGLAALLGIPAALVAIGFLALVHWSQDLLWTDLPDLLGADEPPAYLVVLLPAVGGLVVWVARRFLPGDGGSHPLHGLGPETVPWRHAPG
ncbi:MAG: hypothetical protein HOQ22_18620, partial [Nocardioidaceae bacterium]|nr:hypothetical protein [Nocardioidaceae bacterium]